MGNREGWKSGSASSITENVTSSSVPKAAAIGWSNIEICGEALTSASSSARAAARYSPSSASGVRPSQKGSAGPEEGLAASMAASCTRGRLPMARPSSERHEELEELEELEEEERRSGESVVPESDSTVDFDVIVREGAFFSALSTQLSSNLFTTK